MTRIKIRNQWSRQMSSYSQEIINNKGSLDTYILKRRFK